MLQLINVSKQFGDKIVVDNISFTIKKGEIVGFLGPNGAGKTTTMRLITGFLTPSSGTITINQLPPKEARHLIGYLPEENPLYQQFAPIEYLKFIGQMHHLDSDQLKTRLDYVVENCGLKDVLPQTIETLSRGYKQRVGLAATLIHDPELIVMDEPTTGLDPNQQAEIRALIKKIAKNKAIVFSTHILSEVESICQRALIINQGQLVAEENLKRIKNSRQKLEKIFSQLDHDKK